MGFFGGNMTILSELHAPFLISWLAVWLFAFGGGLASAFIRIRTIDERLLMPYVSKPLIGTMAGVALALWINGDADPPSIVLASWACLASLFSTPIVTGVLVYISDQERQNSIYQQIQSRFIKSDKGGKS